MGPNEPDEILRGAFGDLFEGESTLPPEAVWQNVRAAVIVTEKKRRKYAFFWLIPAVLLVGAGAALLFMGGEDPRGDKKQVAASANGRDEAHIYGKQESVYGKQESAEHEVAADRFHNSHTQPASLSIKENFVLTMNGEPTIVYMSGVNADPESIHYPLLTARLLPARTPEPVTERQPALPRGPEYFFPRWVVGLEVGLGTNRRRITGNYSETYNSSQLVTRDISLNNRCFALTGGYRFNRFVSVHAGISTGVNTYRSDWYLRMLTEQSSGSYVFQTSEGSVKMASEDVNGYFSESDTALFRMRLHYSSRYYSIPVSVKLTLPGTRLSGYVRLGGSYDLHSNGQMKASLRYGNLWSGWKNDTKTVDLENADRTRLRSAQALIGMGVETHRDSPLQFFLEPQMSIPLTPVYNSSGLKVTSQYMQVRAGMTFFLPSHPTKSKSYTSW